MHCLGARVTSRRNILSQVSAGVTLLVIHTSPGGWECFGHMIILKIKTVREINVPVHVPFNDVAIHCRHVMWRILLCERRTTAPTPVTNRGRPPWPPQLTKFANGVHTWHPVFACSPHPHPPRLPTNSNSCRLERATIWDGKLRHGW